MTEIHAGHKPLIQRTQLQHLVQIAQLVDLAHSLRAEGDMAEARIVTGAQDFSRENNRAMSNASRRVRFISAPV